MIKTILIIEENIKIRQKTSVFLRIHGYNVVALADTFNIYEVLYKEKVDFIISGMIQKNLDGFELLKEIKGNLFYSSIPIVISSSIDKCSIINEALRLGATHYILRKNYTLFNWFIEVKTIIDLFDLRFFGRMVS